MLRSILFLLLLNSHPNLTLIHIIHEKSHSEGAFFVSIDFAVVVDVVQFITFSITRRWILQQERTMKSSHNNFICVVFGTSLSPL